MPFRRDVANDYSNYLVVDSTHPSAATLTHHKGHNNVPGVHPLDCSTGYVISALKAEKTGPSTVQQALSKSQVTCDHFDIDAVLSIWCWINRAAALRHEKGTRQCHMQLSLHPFDGQPCYPVLPSGSGASC